MEKVIKRIQPEDNNDKPSMSMNSAISLNMDFFSKDNKKIPKETTTTGKKRGRPKKVKQITDQGDVALVADEEKSSDLPMCQSNVPYTDTYSNTTNLLYSTIGQIDSLSTELKNDLDNVRNSRTLKKKYDYISDMISTEGTLISNKINAIKEINKTITDSHNLDLKRMSSIASSGLNKDDTRVITDMYNAFVQTPIGVDGTNPFGFPNQIDMTVGAGNNIVRNGFNGAGDMGYNNYINSPNAEQAAIQASTNPNLETVVVMDENNPDPNRRLRFEIMDKSTGSFVLGDTPDPMFLENLRLEPDMGIAIDNNLNKSYTLIEANTQNPNGGILGQY